MRPHLELALALLLTTGLAWGQEAIPAQAISIAADSAEIDDRGATSTYRGNVVLTRGDLVIHADLLTVTTTGGRVQTLIASGNPVRFEQQGTSDERRVRGEATRIEYRAAGGVLVLESGAQLWAGSNQFSGSRIEYDSTRKTVRASAGSGGERVQVTIQPPDAAP